MVLFINEAGGRAASKHYMWINIYRKEGRDTMHVQDTHTGGFKRVIWYRTGNARVETFSDMELSDGISVQFFNDVDHLMGHSEDDRYEPDRRTVFTCHQPDCLHNAQPGGDYCHEHKPGICYRLECVEYPVKGSKYCKDHQTDSVNSIEAQRSAFIERLKRTEEYRGELEQFKDYPSFQGWVLAYDISVNEFLVIQRAGAIDRNLLVLNSK